jgi:hypothetical protein
MVEQRFGSVIKSGIIDNVAAMSIEGGLHRLERLATLLHDSGLKVITHGEEVSHKLGAGVDVFFSLESRCK